MRLQRGPIVILCVVLTVALITANYFTKQVSVAKDPELVTTTIWLVWATVALGISTLFLALVALGEIAENRKHNKKALQEAKKQNEAAIKAGRVQTQKAIDAADERSGKDRRHSYLQNFRSQQQARMRLNRQIREARNQNIELIRASHRPLLAPRTPIAPANLKREKAYPFPYENVGSGVASNIQIAIMPKRADFSTGQYHGVGDVPVATGTGRDRVAHLDNIELVRKDWHQIRGIDLVAPTDPPVGQRGLRYDPELRLTFTYEDLFGVKHASIYDMLQDGTYICVGIKNDIPYHIDELDSHTTSPTAS